jgi:hypothetical protein
MRAVFPMIPKWRRCFHAGTRYSETMSAIVSDGLRTQKMGTIGERAKRDQTPSHVGGYKVGEAKVAGVAGLEPVTSAVTGQRSNQLSYTPAKGSVTVRDVTAVVNPGRGQVISQASNQREWCDGSRRGAGPSGRAM